MASLSITRALAALCGVVLLAASLAAQGVARLDSYQGVAVRILQSNNAGNVHHLIDPTTQQVVGLIKGCPHAHNLTVHPDGLYYYCSNEQDKTIDVFDSKTLQQVQQIKLSERPNKIVVNKKHKKIYAAIRNRAKASRSLTSSTSRRTSWFKSIEVHHPVHNSYVTPDDNFVVAGLAGDPEAGRADDPGDRRRHRQGGVGHGAERAERAGSGQPRSAADGVRGESGRLDEADVRAGRRHQRRVGD